MTTAELRRELERALGRRIERLERAPSAYRSSYHLEQLELGLADGATLRLVLKDVSPGALLEGARAAKPGFLYDPMREIETYRDILSRRLLGTATCYGTVVEPELDRYWLFLERVDGVELYQVGELSTWQEVARWLAAFHGAIPVSELAAGAHLLHYDAALYRLWLDRARAAAPGLDRIAERYDTVIERLLALPTAFVHGEFYASNVLVQALDGRVRVCPIDWEMAALGPPLLDLAALVSGAWSDEERIALASSYVGAPPSAEFLTALDSCLLHLAVQWLGWSVTWSPPPAHAHDWLAEALRAAERLAL